MQRKLYKRKKSKFLKIVMGISAIGSIATAILGISILVLNINIAHHKKVEKEMKSSMTLLEKQLTDMKKEEENYTKQEEELEQELSRYQPVVGIGSN